MTSIPTSYETRKRALNMLAEFGAVEIIQNPSLDNAFTNHTKIQLEFATSADLEEAIKKTPTLLLKPAQEISKKGSAFSADFVDAVQHAISNLEELSEYQDTAWQVTAGSVRSSIIEKTSDAAGPRKTAYFLLEEPISHS